ncbi:MAG: hypothetical protein A3G02_02310 [Candidatus Yanofskybacteria bacterium RIFCSPLOWO2_12_FULL_44_13b]|uniref:Excinuclease ABC subunit C n=2 Tax=Candidatus Yanofskyibacteriota TaxID=1752733 RepID=A0A1F8H2B0_9BACT|nr:MAG: hypothetical protein A2657_01865 [Candidatus Yanofskybacteria bacterium RIFCSPHIGHO2_01_FULL_44_110b]OGN18522.1 MAG: hypothetical protein A3F50_02140 [Candidatus Yanofskybacteria bacterium RIFCSPHIGHO2_12_FULL_44_29b]OGN26476.1 MAG: hypothetical protein A3B12_03025 [Candidatus Yanofskybacteria bacterium RIFCSPLOWO2_01_FULL_44_88]OGN31420.1 MAG: hypothetical protein A3I96_01130 [Candidatus Yanofskybacteria bacterium RIFCSPLOWO2_02_FULL_44_18]OGN34585.1 MAG: hypothetical protein A3G02_023
MKLNILKNKIKLMPREAGIYIWFKGAKKLYVGKAGNLRARLKSYIAPDDARIKIMVEKASGLVRVPAGNEIEALILESQYIKKYHPEFNVLMRDDKQYSYAAFTQEEFPRIFITHQPHSKFKNFEIESVGPFTEGYTLKQTLKFLRRTFPYCTCRQKHNNFCLNYHLDRCPGFCCLKHPEKTDRRLYMKNINAIKDMLTGKKDTLIKKMKKEMVAAGKAHDFQKAIRTREQIDSLEKIFSNAKVLQGLNERYERQSPGIEKLREFLNLPRLNRIECYDISNIQGRYATGSMAVFIDGLADKNEYRRFKIRTVKGADDTAMIKEILTRRLRHTEWKYPDLVVIDGGKAQISAVQSVMAEFDLVENIPVLALTKDAKHKGNHIFISTAPKKSVALKAIHPAAKNLILAIDAEAHRFAISYYRYLHRRSALA